MPGLFSSTVRRLGFLPWARIRAGTLQVILPEWLYDLFVLAFFPINWLITLLPSRLPFPYNRGDWPLDPELGPSKLPPPPPDLAATIRRRDNTRLADREVWALFDSLPGPSTSQVIGNWRGKV